MAKEEKDCVFCKIAKGEIPCDKVYEDADTFAFLDINPINPGHTLVIPKKHFNNILDTPPEIFSKVMLIVQKLSKPIMKITKAEGLGIGINNGKAAGQVVNHLHVHIMPRFDNDGYKSWERTKPISKQDTEGLSQRISEQLKK